MNYSDWLAKVDRIRLWQEATLLTHEEFQHGLDQLVGTDSPVSGIACTVALSGRPLVTLSAGELGLDSERAEEPSSSRPNWGFQLDYRRTDFASRFDRNVGQDLSRLLFRLLRSYWKPGVRDESTGLTNLKQPGVNELADTFINRSLSNGRIVGCAFLDADEFGALNNCHGHDVGDQAISEIGASYQSACSRHDCIVTHDGGDEFTVLAAAVHEQDFVDVMLDIYRGVREISLAEYPEIRLSVSCGISFQSPDGQAHEYQELKKAAEAALMEGTGGARQKQRGTMNIASSSEFPEAASDRAVLWARCSLGTPRVFANAWMNLISSETNAALATGTNPSLAVQRLADEMRLKRSPVLRNNFAPTDHLSGAKDLALLDVALAVLHGIVGHQLHSEGNSVASTVELHADQASVQVRCDELLVALPDQFGGEPIPRPRRLATIPRVPKDLSDHDLRVAFKTALLVHVGEAPECLLDLPFYRSIFVDDRPTKGGQLPDFWEHAVSELLTTLRGNPNICRVYCWGDENFAPRTLTVLREIGKGSVAETDVARAVGRPESEVRELCARLEGAVCIVNTHQEILDDYLAATEDIEEVIELPPPTSAATPTLVRDLATDRYSLGISEGFRSESIAEAVPLALEILRQPSRVSIVNDKYGRKFHELIDFKIVIDRPEISELQEIGPIDRSQLNEYYQRAFGPKQNSLFGPEIEPQIPRFLDELGEGMAEERPFTSRRAVIIIPNRLDGEGLHPLGLMAIRASVASSDARSVLRFAYYWRTVEALVGLPHSLYASSKHASHLAELLERTTGYDAPITRLVYVASSLHISSQSSVLEIAKRIVDGASQ